MRTYTCRRCGKTFDSEHSERVYCPECSSAARAATVIRERTCKDCSKSFLGGPRAQRCPDCRRMAQRAAEKRHRQNGTARPIGSTDTCEVCGRSYIVNSARQRYCPSCAPAAIAAAVAPVKRDYNRQHAGHLDAIERQHRTGHKSCIICGAPILSTQPTVTCSTECAREHKRQQQAAYRQRRKNNKEDTTNDH